MEPFWNEIIARQTQACLDMLARAIENCPETLWEERLWNDPGAPGLSAYWYLIYHCLFWADVDLTGGVEGFTPPAPFTLSELDPAGLLPDRVYTPAELLAYLNYTKRKAREKITGLTGEQARMVGRGGVSYAERLVNTIRHIQEHTAQLNLFLGQKRDGYEPGWVTTPKVLK